MIIFDFLYILIPRLHVVLYSLAIFEVTPCSFGQPTSHTISPIRFVPSHSSDAQLKNAARHLSLLLLILVITTYGALFYLRNVN